MSPLSAIPRAANPTLQRLAQGIGQGRQPILNINGFKHALNMSALENAAEQFGLEAGGGGGDAPLDPSYWQEYLQVWEPPFASARTRLAV
eukprot:364851-Chlamydomonas_euryale.AAC.4